MEGCSSAVGVRKGSWTREEDILLKHCIDKYGQGNWHLVPSRAGLNRCRKSCRLRWMNYLKPDIKRGEFSPDEVDLILRLHRLLGNRWSLIAGRIPGRTANDVKNYWNTHLRKKVLFQEKIKTFTNKSSDHQPNEVIKPNVIIKPRPRTFKKQLSTIVNNNNNNNNSPNPNHENDMSLGTSNDNHEPAVPVAVEDSGDYWWERLLGDGTCENGAVKSFDGSSSHGVSVPNIDDEDEGLNFLSELPDLGLPLDDMNGSSSLSVKDGTENNLWTDFVMDLDLWDQMP